MSLHPDIQRLLASFQRRRRALLLLRGFLAATAALALGTLIAVAVDVPLVLDDEPRLLLAGLVYATTAAVLWILSLRKLGPVGDEELAAMLEKAAPHLKGTLLSAVQLSPTGEHTDSSKFREELQFQTARQIADIKVSSLLPGGLLKREAKAAVLAALVIGAGFAMSGERFTTRCLRALFPLANFERDSDVRISILQPAPAEGIVPADEALEIAIEVEGGKALEPFLHTYPAGGTHSKIPMREAGPNRFQASLPVEKSKLQYRIRAGDSLTRKYQLEPRARPKVVVFSRTYHFPNYTGLADRTDTSPDGAITALEGSTVDLVLQADQPLSTGSLGLTRGKQNEELRAKIGSPDAQVLSTAFALTESGVYTARLVSAETGLRSAGGPQHPIRVELDAPPTVSLDVPQQDLVVPLGEKVALAGLAEDDFGLVEVNHEFQVNKGRWQSIPLAANAGKHHEIRCFSDPLQSGAKAGDVVTVRFSAVDGKRQRTDSRSVRISIAPPDTLPRPDRSLAAQKELAKQVKEVANASNEAAAALERAKAQTERGVPDELKLNEALSRARQALEKAAQSAESARASAQAALLSAHTPEQQAAISLDAQALNRIQLADLPTALQALDQIKPAEKGADSKSAQSESARVATQAAAQAEALARAVEEAARTRSDALEAATLAPAARALAREELAAKAQTEAAQTQPPAPSTTAAEPEKTNSEQSKHAAVDEALRRQQINQSAAAQLQSQLQKLAEHSTPASGALKPPLEELRRNQVAAEKSVAAAQTEQLEKAAEGKAAPPEARPRETPRGANKNAQNSPTPAAAAEALAKSLERTASALDAVNPQLQAAADKAREALQKRTQSASEDLARAARDLAALANRKQATPESRAAQADVRVKTEADVQRANAELEAIKPDGSPKLAQAMLKAANALDAARGEKQEASSADKANAGAPAENAAADAASSAPQTGNAPAPAAIAKANAADNPSTPAKGESAESAATKTARNPRAEAVPSAPSEEPAVRAAELAKLLKPVEAAHAVEKAARKAGELASNLARENGPASPEQIAARQRLREQQVQPLAKSPRETGLPEAATEAATEAANALGGHDPAGPQQAADALKTASRAAAEQASDSLGELTKLAPSLSKQMQKLAAQAAQTSSTTAKLATESENGPPQAHVEKAVEGQSELERKVEQLRQALRAEANVQDPNSASGRAAARDADAAAAQLKDTGRPMAPLQQAALQTSETAALLQKAAALQKNSAEQLAQLADQFQKLESGDPASQAAARAALREGEKNAGAQPTLESRERRSAQLAELATASPEAALAKLDAMAAKEAAASQANPTQGDAPTDGGGDSSQRPAEGNQPTTQDTTAAASNAASQQPSVDAKAALEQARAALQQKNATANASAKQALASAVDAQSRADRVERAQEGSLQPGGESATGGPSDAPDATANGPLPAEKTRANGEWGNLPKRLANDMVQGKHEGTPAEYRSSVEAYFRAIAERARGGRGQ